MKKCQGNYPPHQSNSCIYLTISSGGAIFLRSGAVGGHPYFFNILFNQFFQVVPSSAGTYRCMSSLNLSIEFSIDVKGMFSFLRKLRQRQRPRQRQRQGQRQIPLARATQQANRGKYAGCNKYICNCRN